GNRIAIVLKSAFFKAVEITAKRAFRRRTDIEHISRSTLCLPRAGDIWSSESNRRNRQHQGCQDREMFSHWLALHRAWIMKIILALQDLYVTFSTNPGCRFE